ncbi:electron transporter RnfD [Solemya velum gill symbiont]|uniref:Ion-translocating oxidoreductase complex subunit D n=4 Tax=Solemya velum gill symbiont TaxID=2340 RepID=A0A1T2DSE3_SOVGS|nr:RnfABCDGE type electron transport complex subunit D [Solemya velum gill symbiont]OOY35484.1 electron transporter RnfD [Solemya velum gill symbiont]OOY38562.1 electron transporter RnfD [Solemya velum gill symbiont]OOY39295.1 electron transporter RnfD [Solemya velum gill symbiont]OOY48940.1 electron transporter RnfD [Solemya velum gill symbiont]OOY50007.1 electron transporter RnfD [Solemya velum gill symbiont]
MSRKPIVLHTAPHVKRPQEVPVIMRNVVFALLPILAFAIYQFGISVLALTLVVTLTCLATERFFNWMSNRTSSLGDWSAVITGILMALTLPPGFPLWMGVVAGFVGMAMGKMVFGGIGFNVFNPALVGRAFVQAAFPVAITTWTPAFFDGRFTQFIPTTLTMPFMMPPDISAWASSVAVDGFTGATSLGLQKFQDTQTAPMELLTGMTAGSAGETSALLIFVCGLYLAFRNMMNWRIPVWIFIGVTVTSGALYLVDADKYPDPLFMLLSGGLMLGAMFMASDMVGSPVTARGVMIYGLLIGFLTVVIRVFGSLSEGIMYAILLGNAATPLIDAMTQPRVFGARRKEQSP